MTATQSVAIAQPAAGSLFDRRPFATVVAVTGFAMFVVAGLIMLGLGAAAGELAESGMFVLFFVLPGLIGMFLSWKFGRWGFTLPVLLAAALLVLFAPALPFMLAHPEGGPEFIVAVLFVIGAALGIGGGLTGIVQWLRRSARPGATPNQRRAYVSILGATALLVVLSIAATLLARTSLTAEARAGASPVGIHNFEFAPGSLRVAAGETVRLAVRNDDTALHTFTLAEAGVDVSIPAGAERLVEFTAPAAGSYTWFCVPHSGDTDAGRQGMVGQLVVVP